MVPADNLPGVRIVEDRVFQPTPGQWASEGTKVRDDTLATDRDTLFPLQGALGPLVSAPFTTTPFSGGRAFTSLSS
jgi:hypothetical protein